MPLKSQLEFTKAANEQNLNIANNDTAAKLSAEASTKMVEVSKLASRQLGPIFLYSARS